MDWAQVRDHVVAHALDDGWAAAGVAGLAPFDTARARALEAIDAGRMDGMPWMTAERIEMSAGGYARTRARRDQ